MIAVVTKVCGTDLLDAGTEYKQRLDAWGSHVTAALHASFALYGVPRGVVNRECGVAVAAMYLQVLQFLGNPKLTARLQAQESDSNERQSYVTATR
jgi:hypothetical protein